MQTADFDHNAFSPSAQAEQDKQLLVKFYYHPVLDKAATAEEGRPIYKEVEYVSIKVPGSREGFEGPARRNHLGKFPDHYRAFKNRVELPVEGTPLSEWPAVSRGTVEELAFFNLKTVEQLAEVSDANLSKFRFGGNLKRKAQEWLAASKRSATVADLEKQLSSRDAALSSLQDQLDELTRRLDGE